MSMNEQLRRARNFDEMADKIEPFAQSLATLADQYSQGMMSNLAELQKVTEQAQDQNHSMSQIVGDLMQQNQTMERTVNSAVAHAKHAQKEANMLLLSLAGVTGFAIGLAVPYIL